ncbi:MAG TPA: hypothetical protein VK395_31290 [Gemmataceae bacterium]|nr:hypothetical protein [Gemmataceae bacterium]
MMLRSRRFVLRNLPFSTRLAIAAFLACAGVGYFSALVQLHFQHATPGTLLPTEEDTAGAYFGRTGMSQFERLLVTDSGKPFNGSGSMRQAFSTKAAGWKSSINKRAKVQKISLRQAEERLRSERDGERLAVLEWARHGADRKAFEDNNYMLSPALSKHPITEEFLETAPDGTTRAKISSIVESRCTRCHGRATSGQAAQFPLETWEQVHEYCEIETTEGGMSLKKLAQSTHVHLIGFAMLYGLTGVLITLTSYPGWLRAVLGPFTLLAQVVDIGFWWLGRLDPAYARFIVISGGAVAVGLFLQITLSLFDLFGKTGKIILLILALTLCFAGYEVKVRMIDPYLAKEALSATLTE